VVLLPVWLGLARVSMLNAAKSQAHIRRATGMPRLDMLQIWDSARRGSPVSRRCVHRTARFHRATGRGYNGRVLHGCSTYLRAGTPSIPDQWASPVPGSGLVSARPAMRGRLQMRALRSKREVRIPHVIDMRDR
jgi:hypothetical protein